MAKLIAFDEEARRGLERGLNTLADAVKAVSYTHLRAHET